MKIHNQLSQFSEGGRRESAFSKQMGVLIYNFGRQGVSANSGFPEWTEKAVSLSRYKA